MTRDAYAVLGVEPDASADELRGAFRALAADLHPDRHVEASVSTKDQLAARMAEVTNAWRQVSTPEKRHAYDLIRAQAVTAPQDVPTTVRPAVPPRDRPTPRPVSERGRRVSELVLRPAVVVAAGLVLIVIVAVGAVLAATGDGGSTLSEDDVVGRCVLPSDDEFVTFAPAGCARDTLLVVARVFDPETCTGLGTAARLAEDPDFLVCVVSLDP
ncbi:MAG: J domain-containing protein [Acidimicrobiales bacterium]